MARKLSRIARSGRLFIVAAAAASLIAARASAEEDVHVASTARSVVNPFAKRTRPQAEAAGVEPSFAVPPAETGVPKKYQNPFAARSSSPRMLRPRLQNGPLSRWNRPAPPAAAPGEDRPVRATIVDAQPAADKWDLLAPLTFQEKRAALFALPEEDEPTNRQTPPDPSHYGSSDMQQPAWLTPKRANAPSVIEAAAAS